jgi:predicted outer membrane repeat protein
MTFVDGRNTAGPWGGCSFVGDSATLHGGGIACADAGNPTVTGCSFERNEAGRGGGGISNDYFVTATVRKCTFTDNSGGDGAADIDTDPTSALIGYEDNYDRHSSP